MQNATAAESSLSDEYSEMQRQIIFDAVLAEEKKCGTWADRLAVAKQAGYRGDSRSGLIDWCNEHREQSKKVEAEGASQSVAEPGSGNGGIKPARGIAKMPSAKGVRYTEGEKIKIVNAIEQANGATLIKKLQIAKEHGYKGNSSGALYNQIQAWKKSAKLPSPEKKKPGRPKADKSKPKYIYQTLPNTTSREVFDGLRRAIIEEHQTGLKSDLEAVNVAAKALHVAIEALLERASK